MDACIARYTPVIKKWVENGERKPLLAHGPLQSGKKTLLRSVLTTLGYVVMDPDPRVDPTEFGEKVMQGRSAYILRTEAFGTKKLPNIGNAPVVYVCHQPYDFGSKADLAHRFEVLEIRTNLQFSGKSAGLPPFSRDSELSYWQAIEKLGANKPKLDHSEMSQTLDMVGDFFTEIVHMSYYNNKDTDMDHIVSAAETMAVADLCRRSIPTEELRYFDTIMPARYCNLRSSDLVLSLTKAKAPHRLCDHGSSPLLDAVTKKATATSKKRKNKKQTDTAKKKIKSS